ncbi:hypothetical protein Trydic_g23488 [Trypoxylus dichotomus]
MLKLPIGNVRDFVCADINSAPTGIGVSPSEEARFDGFIELPPVDQVSVFDLLTVFLGLFLLESGGEMECVSEKCIAVRARIRTKEASNESINDWATRVRNLATHCEFGQDLDVCLRDRFIMGFPTGPVLDRPLEENVTITLADVMKIASRKMATQDRYGISEAGLCASVKEQPLHAL